MDREKAAYRKITGNATLAEARRQKKADMDRHEMCPGFVSIRYVRHTDTEMTVLGPWKQEAWHITRTAWRAPRAGQRTEVLRGKMGTSLHCDFRWKEWLRPANPAQWFG